ncbi:DNA cross-link repair 1A protein-like [Thrips palmi]|uniref:DNA cross-link repair 1A protein n=1 Tax=Thrips palmi TaxID=161013 RepID=A0A6P8ZYY4_THRPL|nr:DNA cross-link repair 1A protein-like [Thrips palmi]
MGKKSNTNRNSTDKSVLVDESSNDVENNDYGSEEDDFKPRRTLRSKRSQNGTCSKNLSFEDKIRKTSAVAERDNSSDVVAASCKTRSKTKVKEGNTVQTERPRIRVKSDSELVDEDKITPRKSSMHSSGPSSNFCPICQVPLNILKISAATHTATCSVSRESKECPDGNLCLNSNMFHYRDFNHDKLAAFRVSEEYIEPDVIFTPQKAKPKNSTPLRNSSGKKRLAKSPIASQATKRKASETPKTSSSDEKNEQLLNQNTNCNMEHKVASVPKEQESISPNSDNKEPDEAEQQNSQDSELVQPSLWCSDLVLSPDPDKAGEFSHEHCAVVGNSSLRIKDEPESQNSLDENAKVSSATNANVVIHYDTSKESDQNLVSNQMACSESCTPVHEPSEVLQANCSLIIKAIGVDKRKAMAQNPLSVTLAVNSSGWEAIQIKGRSSTTVQKIEVSLCECSHLMSIECCVNNSQISRDSDLDPNKKQEEKFFATMGDMGLKRQLPEQALTTDSFERKSLLLQNCNQITITSSEENINEMNSMKDTASGDFSASTSSRGSCEQPGKVVNAFTLLKSACSKRSDSSGSSTRSAPTPVPMVVSKASRSSWTLVPDNTNYNAANKKVPGYKKIPDTPFVVDAFNYGVIAGVKVYFLSHFHSDHFMGLKKNFNLPIFCSQITANLVNLQLKVDKKYLNILKIGEPRVVCGVEVEVYDANHCPGAVMFLFRLLDGRVFLHVGDFRAHPRMEENAHLRRVDKLYLDTTYCDPSYDFPYQEDVVEKVIETVRSHLSKNKATLIVCGTYTIGKEKVFIGIAEALNCKIWCSGEKRKIYNCLEDKVLLDRLTTEPLAAQVHVLAMRDITMEALHQYYSKYCNKFSHIVGFRPTGWTTSKSINGKPSDFQKSSQGKVTIYGVPYSEHSSFSELRRFVRFVRPYDIQVTVNVSKSAEYKKLFSKWLSSDNDNNGQAKVLQYFTNATKK